MHSGGSSGSSGSAGPTKGGELLAARREKRAVRAQQREQAGAEARAVEAMRGRA